MSKKVEKFDDGVAIAHEHQYVNAKPEGSETFWGMAAAPEGYIPDNVVEVIRACKGNTTPRLEVPRDTDNLRLLMTERTGTDWFLRKYTQSVYAILTDTIREYCKANGLDGKKGTILFDVFEDFRWFAEIRETNKTGTGGIETMNDALITSIRKIQIRDKDKYINGFREDHFEKDITISEETMKCYNEYLKRIGRSHKARRTSK